MSIPTTIQNVYPYQIESSWSRSEKAIARRVFDAALKRELQEVMREAKQMAGRIKEPADLWKLEQYLTRRRRDIDRKYEFRLSRLTRVFGTLFYEGRLSQDELQGLPEDKMKAIRSAAKVLSDKVA